MAHDGREMDAIVSIRAAVRTSLAKIEPGDAIAVAVSGGADSMALALAAQRELTDSSHPLHAIIIDHQLQSGSGDVAEVVATRLREMGIESVTIKKVNVEITDGVESSARRARYNALMEFAKEKSIRAILLGHTRDDQAETVLLGLARGSGARSLAGMRGESEIYFRPLLEITREQTLRACEEEGIEVWSDPHNHDEKFLRVRVRRSLSFLDESIGPGIKDSLVRSADLLRDDADALDRYASEFFQGIDPKEIDVSQLARLPRAVRTRVLRLAIYALGAPAGSLTAEHIAPVEALISDWHGQGETSLPGGVKAMRNSGRLSLVRRG
ncbi:MAG: tRNA lysidine(34) synthetase TilS [Candidatus Nanopelagicaceae bacterium]